ncbi:xylulokinase [Faunimonas pinastri]|uniref:Xylulose kinase n=1 Tax=Faunimonas pinastri TaxID=1855383 RepID=A0A1H9CKD3_9HYPH|nr:xylulokinase [Faunimonas pinastri]SEQ01680.1 xylulokinase [Faunimonas pinastri]
MGNFLGIDIGTSGVKTVLVDGDENVLAEAEIALTVERPHPLWSEQDPESWWEAVCATLQSIRAATPVGLLAVEAIGLSGQMHAAVLLGAGHEVLRPAILWNDGRSQAECAELESAVPDLGTIAGVKAMPGFTAPKLIWLKRHEPEVFARVAHVVLPKDFIRLRLTGELATDMCDAAGTLLLDEARRDWSDKLVAASGLSRETLPRLCEGPEVTGTLSPEVARHWGFSNSVPVVAGAGDAAAGAIGIGAVSEGDAFISLGTSAQYFLVTESYRPRPENLLHTFAHGLPGRWFQMAALLNGASCLAFAARLVGESDIGRLMGRLEAIVPPATDLLFLPYLSGERTPHNDPHARGVFFGLTGATTPEELIVSVLQGVAYSLRDAQECLAEAGSSPGQIAVIGGGARSDLWMQILADVLDRPVLRYRGGAKGPAFGAARLARLARTGERIEEVCRRPAVESMLQPRADRLNFHHVQFSRFKSLYRALKPEFQRF